MSANQDGYAHFSAIGNLSIRARVSVEEAEEAIKNLLSPDCDSENKENEGRRIEKVPGGYLVLNHKHYRQLRNSKERRTYHRNYWHIRKKRNQDTQPRAEADTEADLIHSLSSYVSHQQAADACPFAKIIALYHEILADLPRVRTLTATRKSYVRARWKDKPDIDYWKRYFEHVKTSPFLMGEVEPTKDRVFMANFEWIFKPTNYANIIEGKYHG